MAERFRGKKDVKIDGKGRVSIPTAFRRVLDAQDPDREPGTHPAIFISHRTTEPFLTCWTAAGIDDLDRKIELMHPGDPKRIALEEFMYENVEEQRLDEAGRLVLPKYLREHADLEGDVIFGGRGQTFRIYSPTVPPLAMSVLEQQMALQPEGASVLALLPDDPAPIQ